MDSPRLFIAGATGAVGRTVVRLAQQRGVPFVAHVRPKHATDGSVLPPSAAVFDLADDDALVAALGGCTGALQLIGTMRKRFASGDTYETSDVGTTARLARAAAQVGLPHFVLLSSVGAGRPFGAYLQAKAHAERIVRECGVPFTIVRPSAFVGEGHRLPPGAAALMRLPGLRRFRPIRVEQLAALLLRIAVARAPLGVALEGESLWALVDGAERAKVSATGARD